MEHRKLSLLCLIVVFGYSSITMPLQSRFNNQDEIAQNQRWDTLKSTLWASLAYTSAGTALSLAGRTQQLADNSLATDNAIQGLGSLVCASVAVGLAALTFYSICKSREKYVDALRHDILKKKMQYYRKQELFEPTQNRKQWEHFKSSFWDLFSIGYAATMVGTGHYVINRVVDQKFSNIPPAVALFLAISIIDAPVSYFTAQWAREDIVNAIADDTIQTHVPHSTTARKNWMYIKSGFWRDVSLTSWFMSPLILPAVLAWYSSKWSREALIKAVKEDILEEKEVIKD